MSSFAGVASQDLGSAYRSHSRSDVMALLPPLNPGSKVLEVGCGEGRFCASVPGAGETWGIEPEPSAAATAQNRLYKVLTGTFDAVKGELPLNYFDLVVCNDVIEHMTDHDAFLRQIQDHMAPGCLLLGSLPNVRFVGNLFNLVVLRDWHYQDAGILDRTHFRFFTFRSLRRSLEQAGFSVIRLEGLNKGELRGYSPRTILERLFKTALLGLSAGAARDIQFLQIGFLGVRART